MSQQEHKPTPYRKLVKKRISKYLKNIKHCDHNQKLIYPHYCQYHMKNVVVCQQCGAERIPPTPIFKFGYSLPTRLQKQRTAHDWFL